LDEVERVTEKYQVLKDLDLFVLDNSLRESTVGQLRGHTLENKWAIFNESKKCGFKNKIVASFSHMTRVDDIFIKQLIESGEDPEGLFAFSEITDGSKDGVPDTETVPIGLQKLKGTGIYNVIFEIDLGNSTYDFNKFSVDQMCALVKKWVIWCHEHLNKNAKVLFNFRDLPDAMPTDTERVFKVVDFLLKLPKEYELFALIFEEPRGKSMPEECGTWARYFRKLMAANNFKGHLLVHVHEKFGYCDVTALEVLASGATGVWASVCLEGSSMGNAASCVTLLNLIRMGNKKVLERYNCTYLRQAAINVTKITTGIDPHIKQPIYGARALDMVFDMNQEEFDLAEFFGQKPPVRITTMASPAMFQLHLVNIFGEDKAFTIEIGKKMKEVMLEDLRTGRKEEYLSQVGFAVLFDRAGGCVTPHMRDIIEKQPVKTPHGQDLLKEIRRRWDEWDTKEKAVGDDMLEYDSFYNGFMAPYFSCYRCSDTKKAIKALDMDRDGQIDWSEFCVYLKWAINEYPLTKNADELLDIAFRKGLIPAMRDEILKQMKK